MAAVRFRHQFRATRTTAARNRALPPKQEAREVLHVESETKGMATSFGWTRLSRDPRAVRRADHFWVKEQPLSEHGKAMVESSDSSLNRCNPIEIVGTP